MWKSLVKGVHDAFSIRLHVPNGQTILPAYLVFPQNNGTIWYNKIDGIAFHPLTNGWHTAPDSVSFDVYDLLG